MNAIHERDFYAWTQEQAALLRQGQLDRLDLEHLAEEIETLGRSERRELGNRLEILLRHLLEWRHQPERRGKNWSITIRNQRVDIDKLLRGNPSLRAQRNELFAEAYADACLKAETETGLERSLFPRSCVLPSIRPWTRTIYPLNTTSPFNFRGAKPKPRV